VDEFSRPLLPFALAVNRGLAGRAYRGITWMHYIVPLTRPLGTLSPSDGERAGVRGSVECISPTRQ
jgi:hypothetical protein